MNAGLSKALAMAALSGLLIVLAACKSAEEGTVVDATPTATPAPSPSPTPEELPSLTEALGGGEMLAQETLAKPNLVYAVKSGKHVTVHVRNITTGVEDTILEYEELVEAEHSANLWDELPPSVAMSPAEPPLLVYTSEDKVIAHMIDGRTSETLLERAADGRNRGDSIESNWRDRSGGEICCAYGLAAPLVSPDGAWVAASMIQWEGSTVMLARLDGTSSCVIAQEGVEHPSSMDAVWDPLSRRLLIPSGGAYSAPGLFLASASSPCSYRMLTAHEEMPFHSGSWSPAGDQVAASVLADWFPPSGVNLLLISRDGLHTQILVDERYNLWPLFAPDGRYVYFIRSEDWIDKPEPTPQSLWRYDLDSGDHSLVLEIPDGWSARPRSWTGEGYLVLDVYVGECGYYWGCSDRVVLLDVATGGVVYASTASDFTNNLGFLP